MEITLEIQSLSRAGSGLGRDSTGRVIFVPFTCPGDRVRARITKEDKRYAEAQLIEIVEPSPQRINAPCPVFSKCGGCEWQHLPYNLQWDTKKSGVAHALSRVQIPADQIPLEEFPADQIWHYRNRVQLRGFKQELGFYARGGNQLVPVEKCWIAREEINAKFPQVKAEGAPRVREYKVEVEVFPEGEVTVQWNATHSAQGFRQVHDGQNEKLRSWVESHLEGGPLLLDLYGGRGNLSSKVRSRYKEIHCVDFGSRPEESISGWQFHRSAVAPWLTKFETEVSPSEKPYIDVILDPPREGLGADLAPIGQALTRMPVRKILLVGCDVDSWARAMARFVKYGWKLESLGALDFFPHTHHVEALGTMTRNT